MNPKLKLLTSLIFILCMVTGIYLSSIKLLWNDEIFTQAKNIEAFSLSEIIRGKTKEGNVCPLFYVPQKILSKVLHYKLPFEWNLEYNVYELRSQIILRIPSVIYMSLGLALIFYIFSRYYSYSAGFLAIGLALANPMVWMYWAEARPYSLWFLLTILQASLFLRTFHKSDPKTYLWIGVCHILLSLTIIFSLPQILIVSLALWIKDKTQWKKNLVNILFPILICYVFYSQTKTTYPWMPSGSGGEIQFLIQQYFKASFVEVKKWILSLLPNNVPLTWCIPVILYILFAYGKLLFQQVIFFILISLGLILSSVIILIAFSAWHSSGINYPVSDRYFIFLVPFVIFSIVLCYIHLLQFNNDPLIRKLIHCLFLGTIVISALTTLDYISLWGIF